MGKVIFHIDMNCFFASCEIAVNNSLKGKKMAVAHVSLNKKGMVLSATYEARKCGIYTTMLQGEAERVCPDLIFVEPHYNLYEECSNKFFDYFYSLTDLVEPASIDEAYLDVTRLGRTLDDYLKLAKTIQDYLLNNLQLPCSIGISENKFLAKMGSDLKKPLGISLVPKNKVKEILWDLPINDLFGCGKKTSTILRSIGINKIGDIPNYKNPQIIIDAVGKNGYDWLMRACNGEGSNIVDPHSFDSISSISHAHTLEQAEFHYELILDLIKELASYVQKRLEKMDVGAQTFTLAVKFEDKKAASKSITINSPTNSLNTMMHYYTNLFHDIFTGDKGIRLVSCGASKFKEIHSEAQQLSIFDDFDQVEKDHNIDKLVKDINISIGSNKLSKGAKKINH